MTLRILVLLLWPLAAWAANDEIWVQGVKYPLPFAPLEPYFQKMERSRSPRKVSDLDNPRGYAATWEIRGKALYLIRVSRVDWMRGGERHDDVTGRLFPDQSPPIPATWFTGTLVLDEVPPWKRVTTRSSQDGVVFLGFEKGLITKLLVQSVEEARRNP